MLCQKCGGDTYVTDSRETGKGEKVRRLRTCLKCGHRVATLEVVIDKGVKAEDYRLYHKDQLPAALEIAFDPLKKLDSPK